MLFIHFKKVYDSIHRESLVNVLKKFELSQKTMINLKNLTQTH